MSRLASTRDLLCKAVFSAIVMFTAVSLSPRVARSDNAPPALGDPGDDACRAFDAGKGLEQRPGRAVAVKLGEHRFSVPWCYRHSSLQCDTGCESIRFQFWTPSLDPTERDPFFTPFAGDKAAERKRPQPGPDEWIIQVYSLRVLGSGATEGWVTTDRMIENLTELAGKDLRLVPSQGLTQLLDMKYPNTRTRLFEKTADHSLVIDCGTDGPAPNDLCSGNLDLKDWGLFVRFSLRGAAIPQHRTIVDGIVRLLNTWKTGS